MSIKIEWRNPPVSTQPPTYESRYTAVARVLRTAPGRWAVVHRGRSNGAVHARRKLGPDFEVQARRSTLDRSVFELFARYVPRPETQAVEAKQGQIERQSFGPPEFV
jgi:hypothetical protein